MRKTFLRILVILLVVSIVGTGVIVFIDTSLPTDAPVADITLSGAEVITR